MKDGSLPMISRRLAPLGVHKLSMIMRRLRL